MTLLLRGESQSSRCTRKLRLNVTTSRRVDERKARHQEQQVQISAYRRGHGFFAHDDCVSLLSMMMMLQLLISLLVRCKRLSSW